MDAWIQVALSLIAWTVTPINMVVCSAILASQWQTRRMHRMTLKAIMDMHTEVDLEDDGTTVVSFRTREPGRYLLHDTETGQVWGWHDARQTWVDTGRRAVEGSRKRNPKRPNSP
jgi:hypothetical protein